jgi:hypothetical protein
MAKTRMPETKGTRPILGFVIWTFGFDSDFWFRVSGFMKLLSLRMICDHRSSLGIGI